MNSVFISEYNNAKHYINDRKVLDNETAFTYDGSHAELLSKNNGKIIYERLNNDDLRNLLDIDYSHDTSLVDKLEMLLPRRKLKTRKHKRARKHKRTHKPRRSKKHRTHKRKNLYKKRSKTRSRK